jgi:hypothetical protein
MRRFLLALAGFLALAGPAAQAAGAPLPVARPDRPAVDAALPPGPPPLVAEPGDAAFGDAAPAGHTAYSNESLAELFVTLTHELEWGGRRPGLARYEGPVRVGVTGPGAGRHIGFLDRYLAELRIRAGVPIARTAPPHNLLVRFVPGRDFRARMPRHYCVVAPGRPDWDTFRRSPRRHGTRPFEQLTTITATTVFIPDNAPPHLARACLVEEIAQALGPANDLYGLGPSIFNDDAAHSWPTRLDFLMLETLYAPELRSGLGRSETRARALLALDRLNPEGRGALPLPDARPERMEDWVETLRDAFDRSRTAERRLGSARQALAIAADRAPFSAYHCRSLTALARERRDEPQAALAILDEAARVCATSHGPDDIRIAHVRLEQARLLYLGGRASAAWGAAEGLEAQFAAHRQADRLAELYALQAAVLRAIHAPGSAELRTRADAWRAYAFGADAADPRHWIGN